MDSIKYTNETYINFTLKNYESSPIYLRIEDPLDRVVYTETFEGKKSYFGEFMADTTGDYKIIAETDAQGIIYSEEKTVNAVGLVEIQRFAYLWVVLIAVGAFAAITMAYFAKRRMKKMTVYQ